MSPDLQSACAPGLAKGLLSAGLALGRAAAAARMPLEAPRLRAILASGAALRLQFPAEDLGFVYSGAGAAVAPPDPAPRAAAAGRDEGPQAQGGAASPDAPGAPGQGRRGRSGAAGGPGGERDQARAGGPSSAERGAPYEPTTAPGARLPHCELWLPVTGGGAGAALLATLRPSTPFALEPASVSQGGSRWQR